MKRYQLIPIAPAIGMLVGLMIATVTASAAGPCCLFCQKGRCNVDVDVEEVEIKGFDVECEAICIPPLRYPWECGPLKKCGKIRCVKKLVSDKRTAKICTYDWEAVVCCPECRSKLHQCGSSCDNGTCCDNQGCDSPSMPICDSVGCCADDSTPATASLAQRPSGNGLESSEVTEVIIAEIADVAAPEVTVALVHAIGQATPDADGWVRVTNLASGSLSAAGELIE
ncbi:hypothetical protein [Neorhodopirellula pilleata]|uniref:Uncharacterized protein n=1 Tax=Neorhodopirellula pilleata TaxID=2714738 RepID=A0A5C6A5G6_9BACT|nr:hypothetical protein [Neorhodopirellula pilleata]TWT93573.1 hypothetical protein Pla100_40910 [Neorhodopirellula pilleata]